MAGRLIRSTRGTTDRLDLLTHAASLAGAGLVLEFGVAQGYTITHLASLFKLRSIYGFDSFQGLPESWCGFSVGAFAGEPLWLPNNVRLVRGRFEDTLDDFLEHVPDPAALVHVDCDLYSSTRCVLDKLEPRLVPGTVIVFDEYYGYPGWREHECRAFTEFRRHTRLSFRFVARGPMQMCCVMQ